MGLDRLILNTGMSNSLTGKGGVMCCGVNRLRSEIVT